MFQNNGVNNNNNQNFTLLNHINTNSTKTSSLFYFIEDLISKNDPLLNSHQVKKIENQEREAFLITLEGNPNSTLFAAEGYDFYEHHLTVDKLYSTNSLDENKSKFTLAHYTEQYRHPISWETITVHAYFDTQGQLVSIQVKKLPETLLSIDSELENLIKGNCNTAVELLKKLLYEKASRYIAEKEKTEKLELILDKCSLALNENTEREQYIKAAKEFKQTIAKINRYNDLQSDRREEFVDNMLKMLEPNVPIITNSEEVDKATVPPVPPEEPLQEQSLNKSKKTKKAKAKKTNSKSQEKEALLKNLQQFEKELDTFNFQKSKDINNIINAHQAAQKLNFVLANLVFINGFSNQTKKKNTLSRVGSKIARLPELSNTLMDYFIKGDIEPFKILYSFSKDKIKYSFFYKLLNSLIETNVDEKLREHRIFICDFLFDNSDLYRTSTALSGRLCFINKNNNTGVTALLQAVVLNNLNLFYMLLRHGYNVQSPGIYYQGEVYSLLKSIIYYSNRPEFVKAILAGGAFVDSKIKLIGQPHTVQLNKKNKLHLTPVRNNAFQLFSEMSKKTDATAEHEINKIRWDIVLACRRRHYELIPALAPVSDLLGVAVALAEVVTCRNTIEKRFIPCSMRPGVFFASDTRKLREISTLLIEPKHLQEQVSYIIYPSEENTKEFKPIKTLCDTIREKAKKCSPQTIEDILISLQKLAETEENITFKVIYYTAALIIISQKGKLSIQDKRKLIELNYKIALSLGFEKDCQNQNVSLRHYRQAINVALNSSHAKTLKDELYFKVCCAKVKDTKFAYVEMNVSEKITQKPEKISVKPTIPIPWVQQYKMHRSHSFNVFEYVEVESNTFETVNHKIARSRSKSQ